MIFYFSGTGNSKHVAEKIADHTGERLIYMCEDSIDSKDSMKLGKMKESDLFSQCTGTACQQLLKSSYYS